MRPGWDFPLLSVFAAIPLMHVEAGGTDATRCLSLRIARTPLDESIISQDA